MKLNNLKYIPLLAVLFIFISCSTNEDDIIFTDFELEFIQDKLSWSGALPDDPTSAYDTNSDAAVLGQWVWFDERFSGEIKNVQNPLYGNGGTSSEGQVSCNTCHLATDYFIDQVSNPEETSLGTDWTPRHTPTVLNTAYQKYVGWDGRKDSTWSMTLAPFEAGAVANYGRLSIANLMCTNTDYNTQYNSVFTDNTLDSGGALCTAITAAIADCGYEGTIKAYNSSALYSGQTATDLDTIDGQDADSNTLAYYLSANVGAYSAGPHVYVPADDNWDRLRTDSECYAASVEPEENRSTTTGIDNLCVDPKGSLVYGKSSDKCFSGDGSQLTADQQTEVNRVFANVGKALAAYERLLVDKDSEFDKWVAGSSNEFSTKAKMGLKLFIGKANCIQCHSGPRFTDDDFHNIGVPQGGFAKHDDTGRFDGIATLLGDTFNTAGVFNDDSSVDRTGVTANETRDTGAFKTPTLRSIGEMAPYMHTGGISNLWDVVEFYNFGGTNDNFPGTKDSAMIPRELTDEEISHLVEFLNSLTGADLDSSLTEARSDQP